MPYHRDALWINASNAVNWSCCVIALMLPMGSSWFHSRPFWVLHVHDSRAQHSLEVIVLIVPRLHGSRQVWPTTSRIWHRLYNYAPRSSKARRANTFNTGRWVVKSWLALECKEGRAFTAFKETLLPHFTKCSAMSWHLQLINGS